MRIWTAIGGVITVGLFLSSETWSETLGAKAIFATGEGPTVMVETPQSPAPARSARQPSTPKTTVVKRTAPGPEPQQYMGVSYWVELIGRDNERQRVTADRVFRSGERIRLNMMSNRDGYLYLVNLGSTGRSQVLFPHPGVAGGNNFIRANTPYEIPHGAYIRFDENSGEETILVMLSPTPLSGIVPSPSPQIQALSREDTDRLALVSQQKGAKDLLLEVDTSSPQPASYAVAPLSMLQGSGQMITLQIRLKHQ